jgi:hypothetical protein
MTSFLLKNAHNEYASSSQRGGEALASGKSYQNKFFAYLCSTMLLDKKYMKIICEHFEDIEVQEDSKTVFYQVKSSKGNTLPRNEIIDSYKSFLRTDHLCAEPKQTKRIEYVIATNAKIANFEDFMVRHKYSELDDDLKSKIGAIAGINDDLLKRTYLMRTFPLQEISSVIIDNLFNSLLV